MARQLLAPPRAIAAQPVRRGERGATPLVFYSQVAWDTVWQRPQEQALGLAKHRPVVFVGPVQLHEHALRLRKRWEFVRTFEEGRLVVLSPLILSGEYRAAPIRRINRSIIWQALKPYIPAKPFHFLTNTPFVPWLAERLQPYRVFWDLIDDFCAFEWSPPDSRRLEAELLRHCDGAFAGTGALRDRYERFFPSLPYLASGVQFERLTEPVPEPEALRGLPRPRLLYIGTLNDRLDGSLFAAAARACPQGSVVVVGPKHATFRAPQLPQNVHFLGLQPHQALPGFLQHTDLGLMPFADSPAAHAINPIKTLEYLACGLPVLSTPVPDVVRYYPGVVRTEKPHRWEEAAGELLAGDSPSERQKRVDFARERTWDRLVQAMEETLREYDP